MSVKHISRFRIIVRNRIPNVKNRFEIILVNNAYGCPSYTRTLTWKRAICREPGTSLVDGLTLQPSPARPDFSTAIKQHKSYVSALKSCGVEVLSVSLLMHFNTLATIWQVKTLSTLEDFPDSCFCEDVALCLPNGQDSIPQAALSCYHKRRCSDIVVSWTFSVAILTRPGADSRQGEVQHIAHEIRRCDIENLIGGIVSSSTSRRPASYSPIAFTGPDRVCRTFHDAAQPI